MEEIKYKWQCDICHSGFNNFQAESFDNKIYCPLCYYKYLYQQAQSKLDNLSKLIKDKIYQYDRDLKTIDAQDYFLRNNELYTKINAKYCAFQEILKEIEGSEEE